MDLGNVVARYGAAAAFLVTVAEVVVATYQGRAERKAASWPNDYYSRLAAHLETVFEALLLLDMWLFVHITESTTVPILVGVWIGKYLANERRRYKFRPRPRAKKPKRAKPQQE